MIMEYASVIRAVIGELLFMLLAYKVYPHRIKHGIVYIPVLLASAAVSAVIRHISGGGFFVEIVEQVIFNDVLCFLLFKGKLLDMTLSNTFFIVGIVFAGILGYTGGNFIALATHHKLLGLFIALISGTLLMYAVSALFRRFAEHFEEMSTGLSHMLFATSMILGFVFIAAKYLLSFSTAENCAVSAVVTLFSTLLCVAMFHETVQLGVTRAESERLSKQYKIAAAGYEKMTIRYEDSRKVIHDINKHLRVIDAMDRSDGMRAREYRQMLSDKVDGILGSFHSSSNILNIIMTEKIADAEQNNVKVALNVEDVDFGDISDVDMTSIFANLWDNAIEACKRLDPGERMISVDIGKMNNFIVISFENTFDGTFKKAKNGELVSAKKDHEGVGMSIIRSTVDKYKGFFTYSAKNNMFNAKIMLPVE